MVADRRRVSFTIAGCCLGRFDNLLNLCWGLSAGLLGVGPMFSVVADRLRWCLLILQAVALDVSIIYSIFVWASLLQSGITVRDNSQG